MSDPAQESGAQLIARLSSVCRPQLENLDANLFPNNGLFPKDIAEISGNVGLGKTTLLMRIMAKTILPAECGGKDAMVVFLMTEHNFDLDKFIHVLGQSINDYSKTAPMNESETDVLTTSMQNLTIFRCFDETQFEMAVHNLHRVLQDNCRYCLLTVDNIGAFYHTSKAADKGPVSYVDDVLARLQRVVDAYHLALVYTKPAYINQKSGRVCRSKNVNYFLELVDEAAAGGTDDSNLVYKISIPRLNQTNLRHYKFDDNGCIEWKK